MILKKKKSHSDFPKLGNQHKPEITEWISNQLSAPMCQETPNCLFPGKVAPVVRLGLDKLKPATETGWYDWLPSSPSTELQVSHQLCLTVFLINCKCALSSHGKELQDRMPTAQSQQSLHHSWQDKCRHLPKAAGEPGRIWIATGRPEAPEELELLTSKC